MPGLGARIAGREGAGRSVTGYLVGGPLRRRQRGPAVGADLPDDIAAGDPGHAAAAVGGRARLVQAADRGAQVGVPGGRPGVVHLAQAELAVEDVPADQPVFRNVRQKAGLNREILASGWGILVRRLEEKAPGRVEKINPAYTSQRCSACGHVDPKSRKSQAVSGAPPAVSRFNADMNAARNIAAGHAVTARQGLLLGRPMNREPQLALLSA